MINSLLFPVGLLLIQAGTDSPRAGRQLFPKSTDFTHTHTTPTPPPLPTTPPPTTHHHTHATHTTAFAALTRATRASHPFPAARRRARHTATCRCRLFAPRCRRIPASRVARCTCTFLRAHAALHYALLPLHAAAAAYAPLTFFFAYLPHTHLAAYLRTTYYRHHARAPRRLPRLSPHVLSLPRAAHTLHAPLPPATLQPAACLQTAA